MTADAQWAVQQAVYQVLVGDAALQGLLGSPPQVFDHVPQGAGFPYVVIGESTAKEFDTKTEKGMEQTLVIHTWSQAQGMRQTKDIMAAVVAALDRKDLNLTGHSLILLRFESSQTQLDDDGVSRHGKQLFRAFTEAGP